MKKNNWIPISEVEKKTENNESVIHDKIYEVKYEWGNEYRYGYSWLNTNARCYCGFIDIICQDGGVTQQRIENVIFIKLLKQ